MYRTGVVCLKREHVQDWGSLSEERACTGLGWFVSTDSMYRTGVVCLKREHVQDWGSLSEERACTGLG